MNLRFKVIGAPADRSWLQSYLLSKSDCLPTSEKSRLRIMSLDTLVALQTRITAQPRSRGVGTDVDSYAMCHRTGVLRVRDNMFELYARHADLMGNVQQWKARLSNVFEDNLAKHRLTE